MHIKHGIIAVASAAFIFSAADISASTGSIEEMKYVALSSSTAIQKPMTTGHYIVADASAYIDSSSDATVMSDADTGQISIDTLSEDTAAPVSKEDRPVLGSE